MFILFFIATLINVANELEENFHLKHVENLKVL
jgi:hypothetical protein